MAAIKENQAESLDESQLFKIRMLAILQDLVDLNISIHNIAFHCAEDPNVEDTLRGLRMGYALIMDKIELALLTKRFPELHWPGREIMPDFLVLLRCLVAKCDGVPDPKVEQVLAFIACCSSPHSRRLGGSTYERIRRVISLAPGVLRDSGYPAEAIEAAKRCLAILQPRLLAPALKTLQI
jgi:hypothetical protein